MITDSADPSELIALFRKRAEPLGTVVEQVADSRAAASVITNIARHAGVSHVWAANKLGEETGALLPALVEAGVECRIVSTRDDARDEAVGLTLAHRAIAETGSVLLDEDGLTDRATSLMTLHNIVVVPTGLLVASLDSAPAVLREIAARPGGGYASFVTGPSRTADIEMSLTVGVQGPKQVTVIFVDDLT